MIAPFRRPFTVRLMRDKSHFMNMVISVDGINSVSPSDVLARVYAGKLDPDQVSLVLVMVDASVADAVVVASAGPSPS